MTGIPLRATPTALRASRAKGGYGAGRREVEVAGGPLRYRTSLVPPREQGHRARAQVVDAAWEGEVLCTVQGGSEWSGSVWQ